MCPRDVAPDVATGRVVVVVGGGEVVVVVGADVGCVVAGACSPVLPDDCWGAAAGCVVEVVVGGTVVGTAAGSVLVVAVVAPELEPGRSCATATPMSAVKPVAAKAASRVSRLNRL